MKNRRTRLFFFAVMIIVSLLFYFLGRTHSAGEAGMRISARQMKSGNTILVERVMVKEDASPKRIAITFDDGPHPYYTEQLLDGLKKRDIKATFFVIGEYAEEYPDIVERMSKEGHLIGNHTYSHIQLTRGNREKFRQELVKTNEVLKEITGQEVCYVRPPYGSWDKSIEGELNMFPVLWTIDPLDWCSSDVSCIVSKVCAKAGENDIILMHDQYESTVTAALQIIDILTDKGYEFVTVDEILLD